MKKLFIASGTCHALFARFTRSILALLVLLFLVQLTNAQTIQCATKWNTLNVYPNSLSLGIPENIGGTTHHSYELSVCTKGDLNAFEFEFDFEEAIPGDVSIEVACNYPGFSLDAEWNDNQSKLRVFSELTPCQFIYVSELKVMVELSADNNTALPVPAINGGIVEVDIIHDLKERRPEPGHEFQMVLDQQGNTLSERVVPAGTPFPQFPQNGNWLVHIRCLEDGTREVRKILSTQ